MKHVLFATSEMYPLIKTGGLADISNSLPKALQHQGIDVRVIMPGYSSVLEQLDTQDLTEVCPLSGFMVPEGTRLLETRIADSEAKLWIVDCPTYFQREGGPYLNTYKEEWPDNAQRFTLFCRVVADIAVGGPDTGWSVDVVHCNDWQTGLIPAFLHNNENAPATLLTIHNLAYQGNFSREVFESLQLPWEWWSVDTLEFYGKVSFLKAGIVFADQITTVSPTYADEILTHEQGYGMDGLLRSHRDKIVGILNGVDYETWNPASDEHIKFNYDIDSLGDKQKNKMDLQRQMGLKLVKRPPLIGLVTRLAHQKGIDFVIETMRRTIDENLQWVILGSGEDYFEQALTDLAQQHPEKISFTMGYDEALAHKIEASADIFVMASRYEPCGLNQIYSLRYGTLPLVRNTGGLRDTVINVDEKSLKAATATGFCFDEATPEALTETLLYAASFFRKKKTWQAIQSNAMQQNFGWDRSAVFYEAIYTRLAENHKEADAVH